MEIDAFQELIHATYGRNDRARGVPWSFAWLVEEVGELGSALRNAESVRRTGRPDSHKIPDAAAALANLDEEFADVLAWLSSLAALAGIDLAKVAERRYGEGCPYCTQRPCACPASPLERLGRDEPADR